MTDFDTMDEIDEIKHELVDFDGEIEIRLRWIYAYIKKTENPHSVHELEKIHNLLEYARHEICAVINNDSWLYKNMDKHNNPRPVLKSFRTREEMNLKTD